MSIIEQVWNFNPFSMDLNPTSPCCHHSLENSEKAGYHISQIYSRWATRSNSSFSSVQSLKSCPTLYNLTDCSTSVFPVQHQLPELAQTHLHRNGDAIQPSHPLSSLSPSAFNLSQHQGLFKWASSSHQVTEVLWFKLQYQSFQWIFRTNFL